jgi:hypothetical protein
MSRERWGTFSVKDHLMPQAFVADVLLYDRLVIPFPAGDDERERWYKQGWKPDVLDGTLELLGDSAIHVAWDKNVQEAFKTQYRTALAVDNDADMFVREVKEELPYELTKSLLSTTFLPDLPKGVSKVWAMAAYTSCKGYEEDIQNERDLRGQSTQEQKEHLAMVLSHRFFIPHDPKKSDQQLLKDAIKLSKQDDFKEKRANFYKWQDDIIEQGITDKKAIEEMEQYLGQYNEIVKKASNEVRLKFGFLLLKLALGMPGILIGNVEPVVSGLIDVVNYFKFEKKLSIDAGDYQFAAMIHDVQKKLHWS